MKAKMLQRALAVCLTLAMVFNLMPVTAFAANSTEEVETYLDETYPLSGIVKYKTLEQDTEGRLIVPLNETSLTLKKDSKYTAVWSSDNTDLAAITSNYSSSATLKVVHPTAEVGDTVVTLTLTLQDPVSQEPVGSRDYALLIKSQLPVYSTTFRVVDTAGSPIEGADIFVKDSRNMEVDAESDGSYNLKAETSYVYKL